MPEASLQPPTVAEVGDPFTTLRAIGLLARIERGRPVLVGDIAAALDAAYLDWLFPPAVVSAVALQLQANWMADYRNGSGFAVEDGLYGPTVAIEDSSRVDPWMVGQARLAEAACHKALLDFSRQNRPGSND